jgi:heavy metal sensor kinase
MFSRRLGDLRRLLAFRLTLWYAVIFSASAAAAFFFFYYAIVGLLQARTDEDLAAQVRAFAQIMDSEGLEAVRREAVREAQAAGERKVFVRLLSRFGTEFAASNLAYWPAVGVDSEAVRILLTSGGPVYETLWLEERGESIRIVYASLGPGVIIQLGRSLLGESRVVEAYRRTFAATMGVLLLCATAGGWLMARRTLAGAGGIAQAVRRISEGDLQLRAPVTGRGDEIDQLAATLNHMLDRIQTLVTGIREMTDNIAHDLKGPITRVRGLAEVTLTMAGSLEDYEQMAASTIEECDRLLHMINTMLVISRTEAGVGGGERTSLDLAALVAGACGLFQSAAEDQGLALTCRVPDGLRLRGDPPMLQRLVANLLDNAIRYTPAGGRVDVVLETSPEAPGAVRLRVRDTGEGIAPEHLPHIFERFYRGDPSRSTMGTGLGLSLVRAVAQAHGGRVEASSRPGEGSTFTVELLADPSPIRS